MTTEVTTEATPAVAAPRFKPGQVPVNDEIVRLDAAGGRSERMEG